MDRKLILLIGAILFVLLACSQEKTALSNNVKSAESKPVASVAPAAVSSNIPAKLCDLLRKVTPEVRNV
jgi:PBP1b-binding outer membrane lipoprotein LpoB